MPNTSLKKRLDNIQTVTVLIVFGLFIWLTLGSPSSIKTDNIKFWFALAMVILCLMDALFCLKRGHGWAKAIKTSKEETPTIFWINVYLSFAMAGVCLVGVFYFL